VSGRHHLKAAELLAEMHKYKAAAEQYLACQPPMYTEAARSYALGGLLAKALSTCLKVMPFVQQHSCGG
jgi:hypothetical protein